MVGGDVLEDFEGEWRTAGCSKSRSLTGGGLCLCVSVVFNLVSDHFQKGDRGAGYVPEGAKAWITRVKLVQRARDANPRTIVVPDNQATSLMEPNRDFGIVPDILVFVAGIYEDEIPGAIPGRETELGGIAGRRVERYLQTHLTPI